MSQQYRYPSSGSNNSVGLSGQTAPTSATEVAGVNPSGNLQPLQTDSSGYLEVNVAAGSITAENPSVSNTGAAVPAYGTYVAANQGGNLVGLTSTANGLKVDGSAVTQPVSGSVTVTQATGTNLHTVVDSSALPTGAATSALQSSTQGSVAGGAAASASTLVGGIYNSSTLSLANGQQSALQTNANGYLFITGTVNTVPTGTQSINLAQVNGSAFTLGQHNMASSLSVAIASDQSNVPVSGTVTVTQATGTNLHTVVDSSALPTGAATSALQSNVQSAPGTSATTAITVQGSASGAALPVSATALPLPTGAATSALQTTGNTSLSTIATNTARADVLPATGNITVVDSGSTTNTYFNGQVWYSGTPTAGSTVSFALSSAETGILQISGTWTGTIQSEISVDSGVTWIAHAIHQVGSAAFSSAFTGNIVGSLNLSAKTNYRLRATAAMTGTAVIRVIESYNPSSVYVANSIKLCDSTGAYTAAVKNSSTAPVATDQALVVAVSPNSSVATTQGGSAGFANAPVYNVYSTTNITTTAYTQLIAATTSATNYVDIFDSSGQGMILATGGSGSEVVQYYIQPGGNQIRLAIPAGTRVAYKALTANATSGYLLLNLLK